MTRVELAAALARVDEGAQARPWSACRAAAPRCRGRGARCSRAAGCRPRSRSSRASSPSFGTSDQCPPTTRLIRPVVRQPVEPALLAVAGRGGEHQGRGRAGWPRRPGSAAPARGSVRPGVPMPTKPEVADRVAVADERDGLVGRDDLIGEHAAGPRRCRARPASSRCPGRGGPATCRPRTRRHGRRAAASSV